MNAEQILIHSIGIPVKVNEIQLKDNRVHYIESGSGHPVILIHGINIGWGQWYKNIKGLSETYKVYALDLPGSGYSSKMDFYSTDIQKVFSTTLIEFIKELKVSKTHIIAHSSGAYVALDAIIRGCPAIDKIVIINPIGFSQTVPIAYRLIGIYAFAYILSITALKPTFNNIKKFLNDALYQSNDTETVFVNYYLDAINSKRTLHPFLVINKISGFMRVRLDFIFDKNSLKRITNNVFVILGDNDRLTPLNILKQNLKSIHRLYLKIFPNAGHALFIQYPEKFNKQVIEFLNSK